MHRRTNSSHLLQDLWTLTIVIKHTLDAPDLAFDPAQAG